MKNILLAVIAIVFIAITVWFHNTYEWPAFTAATGGVFLIVFLYFAFSPMKPSISNSPPNRPILTEVLVTTFSLLLSIPLWLVGLWYLSLLDIIDIVDLCPTSLNDDWGFGCIFPLWIYTLGAGLAATLNIFPLTRKKLSMPTLLVLAIIWGLPVLVVFGFFLIDFLEYLDFFYILFYGPIIVSYFIAFGIQIRMQMKKQPEISTQDFSSQA